MRNLALGSPPQPVSRIADDPNNTCSDSQKIKKTSQKSKKIFEQKHMLDKKNKTKIKIKNCTLNKTNKVIKFKKKHFEQKNKKSKNILNIF